MASSHYVRVNLNSYREHFYYLPQERKKHQRKICHFQHLGPQSRHCRASGGGGHSETRGPCFRKKQKRTMELSTIYMTEEI